MKKLIVTLFAAICSLSIWAEETPVNLQDNPPEDPSDPHRAPALLPSVTYEDNDVYVYAPYYIESMEVIIYDATGTAIFSYTSAMVSGKNTIILPSSVSESKYYIVLNFNGFHLIGYF